MKDYMTAAEASKQWDISVRRIQYLCRHRRIPNVIRLGRLWGIPKDAAKPSDERCADDAATHNEQYKSEAASMQKQPLPGFVAENPFFAVYPCDKMTIFVTKKPVPLFKGEFSHLNYEFIITQSAVSGMVLNGEKINLASGMLIAINTEQMHGTHYLVADVSFISIQFEKEFIEELILNIFGVKEARFNNIPIPCAKDIETLVQSFINEYENKKEGYSYILRSLSVHLAVAIFRETGIAGGINIADADENVFIKKAIEYLKENVEESFSLDALSDVASMSKYNFARKFKQMTGKTPYEYYMDIRIMNALEKLSNPHYRVIDVALQCGFKSHSHFSQQFRIRTGITPKEYRKNILRI